MIPAKTAARRIARVAAGGGPGAAMPAWSARFCPPALLCLDTLRWAYNIDLESECSQEWSNQTLTHVGYRWDRMTGPAFLSWLAVSRVGDTARQSTQKAPDVSAVLSGWKQIYVFIMIHSWGTSPGEWEREGREVDEVSVMRDMD